MAERKRWVVDAKILIRACLGVRVRVLIADVVNVVDFHVAEANAAEEDSIHTSARRPSSA